MDEIRNYLLQIVATAILCGILRSLSVTSRFSSAIGMMLGIVMTITLMRPILNIDTNRLSLEMLALTDEGDAIIAQGSDAAQIAFSGAVSEQTANYIRNKALQLGAEIAVEVEVNEGIPVGVTIEGAISPYARSQLSSWLVSEIGIRREAQNWR